LAIGSLRAGYRLPAFAFFFVPARDEPAFLELELELDFARGLDLLPELEPDFARGPDLLPELVLPRELVLEPLELDLDPLELAFEPLELAFDLVEPDFDPLAFVFDLVERDFAPLEPDLEPLERDLEPLELAFEPPELDFEPPDLDPELFELPPLRCSESEPDSFTGGSGGRDIGSMILGSSSVLANSGGGSRWALSMPITSGTTSCPDAR
jgi:hypothetical protein